MSVTLECWNAECYFGSLKTSSSWVVKLRTVPEQQFYQLNKYPLSFDIIVQLHHTHKGM